MNYYEILKVSKNASNKQIRDSYKKLIKKYHPDIYRGNKEFAEKITKDLNDAYDTLSNAEKRAEYDLSLSLDYTTNNSNTTKYTQTQNYNYYRKTYQTPTSSNAKQEKTWDQIFKEKIYNVIDERTKNLNSKHKIRLVLFIIVIALFFTLMSIVDYINFFNSQKTFRETSEQNNISYETNIPVLY